MANAAIDNEAAFLLEVDVTLAAMPVGGQPVSYTLPGGYDGIVIQSALRGDGSIPTNVSIGFNKNQPGLLNVRDSLKPSQKFSTCELYNSTLLTLKIVVVLFNGVYTPI